MVKKRQIDFAKAHPKPGRPVGRKKNVTNTAFKAKKLVMPTHKELKDQSTRTLVDLLQTMKATSKSKDFDELRRLIIRDVQSLPSCLPKIFDIVFHAVLEGYADDNKKITPVEVINTVLEVTNDLQIHTFVPRLIKFLSCAMTNTSIRVKEQSLKVLNCMLQTHPNLICNSMVILTNLLQMLTGPPRKWVHPQSSTKSHAKSSLLVMYSDNLYSPDWRIHVLGHINLFLTEMLKEKSLVEDPNRDEQKVYWDCKSPLHLEIYAGSGLTPMDIEKSLPPDSDNDFYFDDSGSIEAFIGSIITLIPEIYTEEMTSEAKNDDNLVSRGSLVNLSILFQVLSRVSEWMHLIPEDYLDASLKKFLLESVWNKDRFPFFQRGTNTQELSVVRLNLSVSFLFGKFLLNSEDDNERLNDSIFSYVMKVLKMPPTIKYDSIPMIVKIMKIYFDKREIPGVLDFLKGCLAQLCSLLKGNNDNPNEQLLSSLFIKMSLDYAYHFFAVSDCMKPWFNWLFHQLMEIPKIRDKSKINRKLLSVVKKIANRKYQYFLELSQKNDAKVIKGLLNYNDDDVRDAGIFLIYNMKDIPPSVFQYVFRLVSDSKFPTKLMVRLIRLLTCRFTEKPVTEKPDEEPTYSGTEVLEVITFVLNVSIDCCSISSEKWTDYDDNKFTKAVEIYKDAITYVVFPSLHWQEHSVLFDVCLNFLKQLNRSIVKVVATKMIKEILDNTAVLPMHSAIAILMLNKYQMFDQYFFSYQMIDLKFCALLTASVLTHMMNEDEWYIWNKMVAELVDVMDLTTGIAIDSLMHIQYLKEDQIDGIVGYHILRVIKFYLEEQLVMPKDYKFVLDVMSILEDKVSDKTIQQQPLYITLSRHLSEKTYYS